MFWQIPTTCFLLYYSSRALHFRRKGWRSHIIRNQVRLCFLNGAANPNKTCCDNGRTCFRCLGYRCASSSKVLHCCLIILQIKMNDKLFSVSETKVSIKKDYFFRSFHSVNCWPNEPKYYWVTVEEAFNANLPLFVKTIKKTAAKEQLMCVCVKNIATLTHSSVPCGETKLPTLASTQWLQCITMLYYRWG